MINDIRLASSAIYVDTFVQIQDKKWANSEFNEFSEIISSPQNEEKEENQNKINYSSLGAPAGFFADTSMLNEEDRKEAGIMQLEQGIFFVR